MTKTMRMGYIRRVFLKGLVAVLPIAATFYLALWLITSFESLFSPILRGLLGEDLYFPGVGVGAGLIGIFLIGFALEALLARRVWSFGELLLDRMPLVSQVYAAVKQVISYVGGTEQPRGKTVVTVKFGAVPVRMMGLVTRENLAFLPGESDEKLVAVFLPWSYQVGGITIFVPRSSVEHIDLTPQEALRFSLTAGVKKEESTQH